MANLQHQATLNVSVTRTVVRAGQESFGPDRVVERTGDHAVLELVAEGSGSLSLAGKNFQLVPGTLFAHDPSTRPRIETNRRSSLTISYVILKSSTSARLLLEHGPAPGTVTLTSAPGELRDLFDELIKVLERNGPHAGRITELVLERFVLRAAETAVPHGFARGPAFATYLGCRRLIDERWAEFTTLEQVAGECQVDPAYLCRLFRRFDDQTPYQYLLKSKIRHAAVRLVQEGVTVKQVAGELGFADPMHFSRVFSKIVGMPPTRFSAAQRRKTPPPQINREPRRWAPGTAAAG